MKIQVVVHEAEEGGYWAEVPAIPGCATQGETIDELLANVREAIEGCLAVQVGNATLYRKGPYHRDCRMKQVSGKEFTKLLEAHGWRLMRTHGSHHIYG